MKVGPILRVTLLTAAFAVASGCAGRTIPASAAERGSSSAVIDRSLRRADREPGGPLALVVFTDADAVGIDPDTGDNLWRRPVRVFGKPSVWGRTVLVPVRGHKLLALDADSGNISWETRLPGEALTGASISQRWVIATVLADEQGQRSRVLVVSALDGHLMWSRSSPGLMGVPLAVGRTGFVPIADEVVALALPTGRRVARTDPAVDGPIQRVERHGDVLVAATARSYVDLSDAGVSYRIRSRDAAAFERVDGIEPGLGHADGVELRVMAGAAPGAPREALFLGRRVVMAVRLDPYGRPIDSRWVHLRYDQREYVAMHVDGDQVYLVRTDGALTVLGAEHGRIVEEHDGVVVPRGAAFAGGRPAHALPPSRIDPQAVASKLVGLLEDPDPRLLPAQLMATDLLWRNRDPEVRAFVLDLARGRMRPGDDEVAQQLRRRAQQHLEDPWGPATPESLDTLQRSLGTPEKLSPLQWKQATTEVVQAGHEPAVRRLVELLFDPATPPHALVEIARALRDLSHPSAVAGVSEFVMQYHADPAVVDESPAIFYAAELLVEQAEAKAARFGAAKARAQARQTLSALLEDEFTTVALKRFVQERYVPAGPGGALGSDEP